MHPHGFNLPRQVHFGAALDELGRTWRTMPASIS
jgi:hypothetical protein